MSRYVVILVFILSSSFFYAQKQQLLILEQEIYSIDSLGNQVPIFQSNAIDLNNYRIHQFNNKSYLLKNTSGLLFEITSDTLIREDKSYDDKVHTSSLDFVHRDTLFRFGGYGYFKTNKNLIYFDKKSKEWDLVKFNGYNLINGFREVQFYFIKDNKLYVFGYESDYELQNEFFVEYKGFIYDFDTRKIEKIFDINPSFNFPSDFCDINDEYLFMISGSGDETIKIFDKNTFEIYEYKLAVGERSFDKKTYSNSVIVNGNIYYVSWDLNDKKQIKALDVYSKIENKTPTSDKLIVESNFRPISLFIVFILIIFILYYRLNLNKLKLTNFYLRYKTHKIALNEKSIKIIQMLLNQSTVMSNQLNDIFYVEGLNPNHINRMKNNHVEKINILFYKKFNKDLIYKKKTEKDKRQLEYFINPEVHLHKKKATLFKKSI